MYVEPDSLASCPSTKSDGISNSELQPILDLDTSRSYSQSPSQVPVKSLHTFHATDRLVKIGESSVSIIAAVGVCPTYVSVTLTNMCPEPSSSVEVINGYASNTTTEIS